MNIGSLSTAYTAAPPELRSAELNSVGTLSSSSRGALSERPVSPVGKSELPTSSLPSSDSSLSSGTGLESDTELAADAVDQDAKEKREQQQLKQDQEQISQLSARDREVRAHEQAHAAVGGQYAGAPQYEFQRGPDGVNYAVGGEVSIDVSRAATPQETINKMQVVRRAALAPAEPSPQDRSVAAQASANEAEARRDLAIETREKVESAKAQPESESNTTNGSENNDAFGRDVSEVEIPNIALERSAAFTPFRASLPPSAINNQLQSSILASRDLSGPGSLFDQLV